MGNKHAVAIDGPSGAGKSTIARAVSRKLGYTYVDTGAMFRAMGLYFLRKNIAPDDETSISKAVQDVNIAIRYENGIQQVFLNGENVSDLIRTEEVGSMASASSIFAGVRKKLLELQQKIAAENSVVMDGRDIGTVVLPDADTKIFLTASPAVRAYRRWAELTEKGISCSREEIEKEMKERDLRDSSRQNAPLKQADDAVLVDSSNMNLEEVTQRILRIVQEGSRRETGDPIQRGREGSRRETGGPIQRDQEGSRKENA